ncbi:unnamed protein product [Euphydryas editha]|uniref:DUF4817 domain-containing protein n=1 Tax=Euphydryas editha TaxID=104508 RepID=A0AAU9TLE7_EUPED|nr:unnamed protein product [Euphydryas editha]
MQAVVLFKYYPATYSVNWLLTRIVTVMLLLSFFNNEYTNVLYCYDFTDGNAAEARRVYQRCFPDRRLPRVSVFGGACRRLSESGSVQRTRIHSGRKRQYTAQEKVTIIEYFIADPNMCLPTL